MALELGSGPDRNGVLHEIGAADDLFTEGAQQLDRASIDAGDVGDGVARRVFDGDAVGAFEQRGEQRLALLPGAVDALLPWQRVEHARFERAHEATRFAASGDEVVPAPRHDLSTEAKNLVGDRVRAAEVAEKPA